jgi:multiple sugar transport system permease protein
MTRQSTVQFLRTLLRVSLQYGVLSLLSIAFILPFAWMFSVSLHDLNAVFVQPFRWIPESVRWNNYQRVFDLFPFWRSLVNTIVVSVSVVLLTLASCTVSAYGFSRLRFRGRNALFAVCLSTMMLPGQVTMIPLYVLYARMGWVDTFLPLIVPALFGSPFYIFLLRQFFLTIPREYDEAALIDGASRMRIYWSIILPQARPAIVTVALFCFVGTWNDFFGPLIYLNSPEKATLTLGLHMMKSQILGTGVVEWNSLMAAAILVMAPTVVVFFFAQRYFIQGIQTTGLKG